MSDDVGMSSKDRILGINSIRTTGKLSMSFTLNNTTADLSSFEARMVYNSIEVFSLLVHISAEYGQSN